MSTGSNSEKAVSNYPPTTQPDENERKSSINLHSKSLFDELIAPAKDKKTDIIDDSMPPLE